MKKDNRKNIHSPKHRLRIASINLLNKDNIPGNDENPTRESTRTSRTDEEMSSELPQFYHHPRRPRNFDPL